MPGLPLAFTPPESGRAHGGGRCLHARSPIKHARTELREIHVLVKTVKWRKVIGWVLLLWGIFGVGAELMVILRTDTFSTGLAVFTFMLSFIYIFIGQYLLRKKRTADSP